MSIDVNAALYIVDQTQSTSLHLFFTPLCTRLCVTIGIILLPYFQILMSCVYNVSLDHVGVGTCIYNYMPMQWRRNGGGGRIRDWEPDLRCVTQPWTWIREAGRKNVYVHGGGGVNRDFLKDVCVCVGGGGHKTSPVPAPMHVHTYTI